MQVLQMSIQGDKQHLPPPPAPHAQEPGASDPCPPDPPPATTNTSADGIADVAVNVPELVNA